MLHGEGGGVRQRQVRLQQAQLQRGSRCCERCARAVLGPARILQGSGSAAGPHTSQDPCWETAASSLYTAFSPRPLRGAPSTALGSCLGTLPVRLGLRLSKGYVCHVPNCSKEQVPTRCGPLYVVMRDTESQVRSKKRAALRKMPHRMCHGSIDLPYSVSLMPFSGSLA